MPARAARRLWWHAFRDPPPVMRILQAMGGGEVGGAEAFFVRLAAAFRRAGVDQSIAIRRNHRRAAALDSAGLHAVEMPFGGRFDSRTRRMLTRQLDVYRPDIVLSWMSRAARVAGLALRGRRAVHVARLGGYYKLKYYRRCDHLIGNTPDIVDYLVAEGWPADRAHFVPNFVAGDPAPAVDRATLDTPAGAPVILALGRLHPNKGFDVLIRALADIPGAYLWLAGEGTLRAELAALADALGVAARVRFLGWRDDVAALMAACDVLACPSRVEPLGNVIIEAWAQRLPVVAAASAGPEWLIGDGGAGLLAPIDDAGALAAGINRVIGDAGLGGRLAEAGWKAYGERFTEQVVVRRYLDLFAAVCR